MRVDLDLGVLDGSAEHAFLYGACGALAIAIHDATGWPVVAVTDAHNVYDGQAGGGSSLHWVIEHPSGRYLDVLGLHTAEELIDRYEGEADDGEAAVARSTRADVVEWYVESQGEPVPVKVAATFVDAVLERAQQQIASEREQAPAP